MQQAVQAKPGVKLRAGVEAFPVSLSPGIGGRPLPREVQTKMERALGASFSDVRIHVGSEAPAIGAIAFTWGTNIHFAPGQYNPHTPHGQILLGHELVHVVQQRAGRVTNPFGNGVAVVQDASLEAEADRLGRYAAMSHFNSSAESVPGRKIDTRAQISAQGTAVNCKTGGLPLAQLSRGVLTPVAQTGIALRLPALQTKAASPMGGPRNRASSAIQCSRISVFAVNHGVENIDPYYDDVHITQLEPSEIDNPSNHAHLARAGELMHLTFRSLANNSHVVHWFYNGNTGNWRTHAYNTGCPVPETGDASALRRRAVNFAYGPSLADFIVTRAPKKKKGKPSSSGSPSSSAPTHVHPSATPLLPPAPLAATAAPLSRLAMPTYQNLPWRWDEDYGLGSAAPQVPLPTPLLPVALTPPIGPAGLNAAADPVVPGFRRGGGGFGPIGPIGPGGLNVAADPVVPGFGRGGNPAGPIGPPRRW
ncbi:hypothetical protein HNQ77_001586 [Silvibacterium bohemicum]|uniref:eCIS core domain-containing protein n=1 Tax=Silvibacterium bohemicum TaxID=1577686 RepID=A0A841JT12_9BACT|nr:DUF4157 domain-containing protein [Silvibacterium bohemicum]MBB6143637.1 hypothetical protein [Silvibacterium bohemicum]